MRFSEMVSGWRFLGQRRDLRRRTVVRVRPRPDSRSSLRMRRTGIAALALGGAGAAVLLLWLGMGSLGRALYSQNDRFVIRHIKAKDGEIISARLIKEYTRIREGKNIFAANIARVREDFLNHVPNVKAMEIRRVLPDTIELEIVERIPLARVILSKRESLVADREGCLFAVGPGYRDLPMVFGCSGDALRPGSRVRGMAEAAIQVLDACDNPRLGVRVLAVDVRNPEYLVLYLADGKPVKFVWDRMGEPTLESRQNLLRSLVKLAQARQSAQGRSYKMLDATYVDMIVAQ